MQPKTITCYRLSALPSADKLQTFFNQKQNIILRTPTRRYFIGPLFDTEQAVQNLQGQYPDCSVFISRQGLVYTHITLTPVLSHIKIMAYQERFKAAVQAYINTANQLKQQYDEGVIPDTWSTFQHGHYYRFEHEDSGQWVEAPLSASLTPETLDPYFWALFVKSTEGFADITALIQDDFHDAERVLSTLYNN